MVYTRLAQRAQAFACILAPALFILAAIMFVLRLGPTAILASSELFNATENKLHYYLCSYAAHLFMIPAIFALTSTVGQRLPRLALLCAVMALLGLGTLIGQSYQYMHVAIAALAGFPMEWDFFMQFGIQPEMLITGLPILLYFLAYIVLGVSVVGTGVLPRWSGLLLIAAGLLQFDSNGPQLSGLPLLTGLLAAICLLLVYRVVAREIWPHTERAPILEVREDMA